MTARSAEIFNCQAIGVEAHIADSWAGVKAPRYTDDRSSENATQTEMVLSVPSFDRSRSGASLSPVPTTYRRILITVFVVVTIVVAVFPVTIVTMMFTVFVAFSFFAAIPLTIVPLISAKVIIRQEKIAENATPTTSYCVSLPCKRRQLATCGKDKAPRKHSSGGHSSLRGCVP